MSMLEREASTFFHTYKRIPLEIERGEGMYLFTRDGRRYLDMFSGLAVNALGYGHERVVAAIERQTRKFIHLSNYYLQEPQIRLAEMLVKYSGYERVFFSNSGTESIEGALKIARKWGSTKGKNTIISFSNAFHGRTMGALSMMDRPKYREGYGPFLDHFCVVPFNDPSALEKEVNESTAAIVLEFIQGEGGICPASADLVKAMQKAREKFGCLIIADEIQAGIGRTGKLFGFEHFEIRPDIVVLAKPIGGGLPLGAILGGERVADVLQPGVHGTTFGGNPVACAAGIAVLTEVLENGVMQNASKMGALLKAGLLKLKNNFPHIVHDVRGYGLMVGMELKRDGDDIVVQLREKGILLNCTNMNVLRFLPPLIVEEQHIRETLESLRKILAGLS